MSEQLMTPAEIERAVKEACAKVCDEQAKEPECPERAAYCAKEILALPPMFGDVPEATTGGIFPERDKSKPAEEQGVFHKFDVRRVDGSDAPGGKHYNCRYFVLDLDHDKHAQEAMRAYASACKETHPKLSEELSAEFGEASSVSNDAAWLLVRDAACAAIAQCKDATGQHRQIDLFVSANQIAHDVMGTDHDAAPTAGQEAAKDAAPVELITEREMAIREARKSARLMLTEEGHEVVCIEPQLWEAICSRAAAPEVK